MTQPLLDPSAINLMINQLSDYEGVAFGKTPDYNITVRRFNNVELTELNQRKDVVHVIADQNRAGADYFYQYLEQTYFEPDTPANDEYEYRIVKWGLYWCVATIPASKKHLLEDAAKKSKMRLANGIPLRMGFVLGNTRPEQMKDIDMTGNLWFPINGDNAWTLENDTKEVYQKGGEHDLRVESLHRIRKLYESRGLDYDRLFRKDANQ